VSVHGHCGSQGNEHVKRGLQKTLRDGVDVTWRGRAFRVRAAAIRKARSPTVDTDSRVRQTGSDDVNEVSGLDEFR